MDRIIKWADRMVIDKNWDICKYFGISLSDHIGIDCPVCTEHGTNEVMVATDL